MEEEKKAKEILSKVENINSFINGILKDIHNSLDRIKSDTRLLPSMAKSLKELSNLDYQEAKSKRVFQILVTIFGASIISVLGYIVWLLMSMKII